MYPMFLWEAESLASQVGIPETGNGPKTVIWQYEACTRRRSLVSVAPVNQSTGVTLCVARASPHTQWGGKFFFTCHLFRSLAGSECLYSTFEIVGHVSRHVKRTDEDRNAVQRNGDITHHLLLFYRASSNKRVKDGGTVL